MTERSSEDRRNERDIGRKKESAAGSGGSWASNNRIDSLLAALTLEEKVKLLSGVSMWQTAAIERLGIPSLKLSDGPNGVRGSMADGASSACFPVGSALGATWNPVLIEQLGHALASECRTKDVQVLLGPTINLHRTPIGGRNFECFSEDPHLTGELAVAYVQGLQQNGIAACPKHFVANDTEFERHSISSEIDERTLREMYLKPFEMVVRRAAPWTIMSAYNKINGVYASSHTELLTNVLKKEWGFDGVVVSDWGAALETVENAVGGLDLEMPGPARIFGRKLLEAVEQGRVSEAIIFDKVKRLLRVAARTGKLEREQAAAPAETAIDKPAHRKLARRLAQESMVLIKNDGILPFDKGALKNIAVIGPNAEYPQIMGGGSSMVLPHYVVSPLEGVEQKLGDDTKVRFEPGCLTHRYAPPISPEQLRSGVNADDKGLLLEIFEREECEGEVVQSIVYGLDLFMPGLMGPELVSKRASYRLSGFFVPDRTGEYEFGLYSAGPARLLVDNQVLIDNWTDQTPGETFFNFGSREKRNGAFLFKNQLYRISIEGQRPEKGPVTGVRFGAKPPASDTMMADAVAAAKEADAVVLVVGTNKDWETEGHDRQSLALPGKQSELIEKVLAANPNTVIVTNSGGAIEMPWLDEAKAVLHTWFPGQEFGNALADVVFGDVAPSGKMPTTFPKRLEDTPAFTSYPGENGKMPYAEGLYMGYRWYDARDIEPLVAFGHGLSYTEFDFQDLSANQDVVADGAVKLRVKITNVGDRPGQETVQLYAAPTETPLRQPAKQLKKFQKVSLSPGQSTVVEFSLSADDFAYWDTDAGEWRKQQGAHALQIGASSRDVRIERSVEIPSVA